MRTIPSNLNSFNKYYNITKTPTQKRVLSDVDGTLVKGSLVLQHAESMHKQGIINLGDLPEQWNADKKNEALIIELAEAYRDSITGMKVEDLGIENFLNTICSDKNNFYSPLQRLIKMQKLGHDITLVSGSPSFLVESFGNRFGFKSAASIYAEDSLGRLTGEIKGMFNATAKREYVSSLRLNNKSDVYALGDTASDVPLFEVAGYSVLVAPNQETRLSIGKTVNEIVEF